MWEGRKVRPKVHLIEQKSFKKISNLIEQLGKAPQNVNKSGR